RGEFRSHFPGATRLPQEMGRLHRQAHYVSETIAKTSARRAHSHLRPFQRGLCETFPKRSYCRDLSRSPRRARRPRRRNRLPGFMDGKNLAAMDSGGAAPGYRGCLCLTRHRGGRSSPFGDEREGAIYNRNRKRFKLRLPAVAAGGGEVADGKVITR